MGMVSIELAKSLALYSFQTKWVMQPLIRDNNNDS